MDDPRSIYQNLAEAHFDVLTAWKAATDPIKRAALEAKKALLEHLMRNIKKGPHLAGRGRRRERLGSPWK